jgi:hypothetical protein
VCHITDRAVVHGRLPSEPIGTMKQLMTNTRKKARSIDGRLAVRQRFKLASEFLRPLSGVVARGFATRQKGKTAHGRAMSYLLMRAVEGDYPNQYVNPAQVRLSEGVLQNPVEIEVSRQGALIRVEATSQMGDITGLNLAWDDRLVLCAYHPGLCVAGTNDEERLREEGFVALQLPPLLADKTVHLYLMVHDRDGRQWSNSRYLGEF